MQICLKLRLRHQSVMIQLPDTIESRVQRNGWPARSGAPGSEWGMRFAGRQQLPMPSSMGQPTNFAIPTDLRACFWTCSRQSDPSTHQPSSKCDHIAYPSFHRPT
eukprot:CAMPEP_0182932970 /NCGR_PEP_ID=MMETSP0105_2-20130417/32695_1 /TAXON_ID=81532 ORGANISM="Acanthoeca-like sp., Strain 10tr" /NCGR_SAMPLE_ID=MMETSP0105_2 /ASSEMBLY_ACC=CAM_ASM_000205 /LENGTH=104 /DNA_ID=CAMNT_0025071635 /DNA_START=476 /DNA_END=786 /DNA_ORIENTATION=+